MQQAQTDNFSQRWEKTDSKRKGYVFLGLGVGMVAAVGLGIALMEETVPGQSATQVAPSEIFDACQDYEVQDGGDFLYTFEGLGCDSCVEDAITGIRFSDCNSTCSDWQVDVDQTFISPVENTCEIIFDDEEDQDLNQYQCPEDTYTTVANIGCRIHSPSDILRFVQECKFFAEDDTDLETCFQECDRDGDNCVGVMVIEQGCFLVPPAVADLCDEPQELSTLCVPVRHEIDCFDTPATYAEAEAHCNGNFATVPTDDTFSLQLLRIGNECGDNECWFNFEDGNDDECGFIPDDGGNFSFTTNCTQTKGFCCETETFSPTTSPTTSPTVGVFFVPENNQTDFETAEEICDRYDADLASIHSRFEQDWAYDVCKVELNLRTKEDADSNDCGCWIGLFAEDASSADLSQSDFEWTDGSPQDFDGWQDGKPDNNGNSDFSREEACAHMRPVFDGEWNDIECGGFCDSEDSRPIPLCRKRTNSPTENPTISPTGHPTFGPTSSPTDHPTTSPTLSPTFRPSLSPTRNPTFSPTVSPTFSPSTNPTVSPTDSPTTSPTVSPSVSPTSSPTDNPTVSPTSSPSTSPTLSPTNNPTVSPTFSPSTGPTTSPTVGPSASPTLSPTVGPSASPTFSPTTSPSVSPTNHPTTSPTASPTSSPTSSPTLNPSASPTTSPTTSPTKSPTDRPTTSPTDSPTLSPTLSPSTSPTTSPTDSPTFSPTNSPTSSPTFSPTNFPTRSPTTYPTTTPSHSPTTSPTDNPTLSPTLHPTESPSASPTVSPTDSPSFGPTTSPTYSPTTSPTSKPTLGPSSSPTLSPTESPSNSPTVRPSATPTVSPSLAPTESPTLSPTVEPTTSPTEQPTTSPTSEPTDHPTQSPTTQPTTSPTDHPTVAPTDKPTDKPTESPTNKPTAEPTERPSNAPTGEPTLAPSVRPSVAPTDRPTVEPTREPTYSPTVAPTDKPTESPTLTPTFNPSVSPTFSPTGKVPPEPLCRYSCDDFVWRITNNEDVRQQVFYTFKNPNYVKDRHSFYNFLPGVVGFYTHCITEYCCSLFDIYVEPGSTLEIPVPGSEFYLYDFELGKYNKITLDNGCEETERCQCEAVGVYKDEFSYHAVVNGADLQENWDIDVDSTVSVVDNNDFNVRLCPSGEETCIQIDGGLQSNTETVAIVEQSAITSVLPADEEFNQICSVNVWTAGSRLCGKNYFGSGRKARRRAAQYGCVYLSGSNIEHHHDFKLSLFHNDTMVFESEYGQIDYNDGVRAYGVTIDSPGNGVFSTKLESEAFDIGFDVLNGAYFDDVSIECCCPDASSPYVSRTVGGYQGVAGYYYNKPIAVSPQKSNPNVILGREPSYEDGFKTVFTLGLGGYVTYEFSLGVTEYVTIYEESYINRCSNKKKHGKYSSCSNEDASYENGEDAMIEVSVDGYNWITAANSLKHSWEVFEGGDDTIRQVNVSLPNGACYKYIRLSDKSYSSCNADDGFDLHAIVGGKACCPEDHAALVDDSPATSSLQSVTEVTGGSVFVFVIAAAFGTALSSLVTLTVQQRRKRQNSPPTPVLDKDDELFLTPSKEGYPADYKISL
eukprot:augustus_masked-scaffold_33-processed-gene-1.42-mRNA-1 protein AED:0.24 eAED:0.25 QI:0/-1/0/1/-1/1/1/0/1565